jgi:hypothetical protein
MGGGHYTAYGKNFLNGLWYDFNDSYVSPMDPSRLVSRQAYVLFYRRRAPGASVVPGAVPSCAEGGAGAGGGGAAGHDHAD